MNHGLVLSETAHASMSHMHHSFNKSFFNNVILSTNLICPFSLECNAFENLLKFAVVQVHVWGHVNIVYGHWSKQML